MAPLPEVALAARELELEAVARALLAGDGRREHREHVGERRAVRRRRLGRLERGLERLKVRHEELERLRDGAHRRRRRLDLGADRRERGLLRGGVALGHALHLQLQVLLELEVLLAQVGVRVHGRVLLAALDILLVLGTGLGLLLLILRDRHI